MGQTVAIYAERRIIEKITDGLYLRLSLQTGKTMIQTIEALFDGKVLRPDTPLPLVANTRVRLTIETLPVDEQSQEQRPRSFLRTARSLNLEGPVDWSSNLDHYLYGEDNEPTG
jgi:hypothetical protein